MTGNSKIVDCDTVSGDVHIALSGETLRVNIKTVSGRAYIHAPQGTGGIVSYSSVSGGVVSSFPGIVVSEKPGRKEAHGTFGQGVTAIEMASVSGGLTIR